MVVYEVVFPDILPEDLHDHKKLGTGCFGKVYTCNYMPIGKVVVKFALKRSRLDQDDLEKEFKCLVKNGTSHPNIVQAYGMIHDPLEGLGLVMEYIPGGTLESMIFRKDMVYHVDHIINWMRQLNNAIAHMHEHDVIHRDLKPNNILLDPSYTKLKICDFGFARTLDVTMSLRTGTWYYMAPEVMMSGHYDAKCDVYSMGLIMWQLVTRERPYSDLKVRGELEYMHKVGKEGVRPRKVNCIPELTILMNWCWDANPQLRPAGREIREHLMEMQKVFGYGTSTLTDMTESTELLLPIGVYQGDSEEDAVVKADMPQDATQISLMLSTLISSRKTYKPMPMSEQKRLMVSVHNTLDRPSGLDCNENTTSHITPRLVGVKEIHAMPVIRANPTRISTESLDVSDHSKEDEKVVVVDNNNVDGYVHEEENFTNSDKSSPQEVQERPVQNPYTKSVTFGASEFKLITPQSVSVVDDDSVRSADVVYFTESLRMVREPNPLFGGDHILEESRDSDSQASVLTESFTLSPISPLNSSFTSFSDAERIQKIVEEEMNAPEPVQPPRPPSPPTEDIPQRMTSVEKRGTLKHFEATRAEPHSRIRQQMNQLHLKALSPTSNVRPREPRQDDEHSIFIKSRRIPKNEFVSVASKAAMFERAALSDNNKFTKK